VISINNVYCRDLDKDSLADLLSKQNVTIVAQTETLLATPLSEVDTIQAYTQEDSSKRCDNGGNLGCCVVLAVLVLLIVLYFMYLYFQAN